MVSILDTGLASVFSSVVVFLLIYTVVWGVLRWKKWMGEQPGTYALIAFTIAFLFAIAPPARNFVMFVSPWFVALAMVAFFLLFITSMFGIGSDKFPDIIKDSRARNWIVILSIVIIIAGLAYSFGQSLLEEQPGVAPSPRQNVPQQAGDQYGPGFTDSVGAIPIGQEGPTGTSDFSSNVVNTLVHPKVLGLIITLLIMSVAVYFLSTQ